MYTSEQSSLLKINDNLEKLKSKYLRIVESL